ncbi:hypothetical protein [Streptomyces sp. NBC_00847]|uniref:hypothetical protein n=1 Tax=unclassified Streptomyces TaxID=2593676 RepID=UPI0022556E6E|nr:hypothetical protein [Streptomyces sp. NBC_00847]MCX4882285.1 hypothetical protein [Streptomyces sp. NBC_00847]
MPVPSFAPRLSTAREGPPTARTRSMATSTKARSRAVSWPVGQTKAYDVLGFTALQTGLGYLGEGAAATLGGMYVAKLLSRFGGVRVLGAGLLIQGVGTVGMFALPQDVNLAALLVTSSVMGLGHVFSVVSFITVMTTGVTEEDQGVVGGLSQLPQYVAAIGVSGLSAIAAARTSALSSGATPSRADILGGLHTGMVTAGVVALAGAVLVGAVLRRRTTA